MRQVCGPIARAEEQGASTFRQPTAPCLMRAGSAPRSLAHDTPPGPIQPCITPSPPLAVDLATCNASALSAIINSAQQSTTHLGIKLIKVISVQDQKSY